MSVMSHPRRRLAALCVLACWQGVRRRRRQGLVLRWNWSIRLVFRVCADPRSMPFSNQAGEGFENKLAEMFAAKLGKTVSYTWFPRVTGFVRTTLNALKCDVIMGDAQGDDLVQTTNPYYHAFYTLVMRADSGLDGVETLDDARLKGKHIGLIAGTPPATILARNGLIADARPFPLTVDTRYDAPAKSVIDEIAAGTARCRRAVGADRRLLRQTCRAAARRGAAAARTGRADGVPYRHGRAAQRPGLEAHT